jgi:hypothetical protein
LLLVMLFCLNAGCCSSRAKDLLSFEFCGFLFDIRIFD